MKSGFVSIIGRPNTGKSTLLNSIINAKVAITSDVAGTTRHVIEGIYNDDSSQIVFIDTPGIGKPLDKLGRHLNKEATSVTKDVDLILFVVDSHSGFGKGDQFILDSLKENNVPVILVLNKIDKLKTHEILESINDVKNKFSFCEIVPLSALKKDNLNRLIDVIKKYLKDDVKYYGEDEYTTITSSFLASEIVREKILRNTFEEVPHGITCYTEEFIETKDLINIRVTIVLERNSFKKIILGKNGSMIKKIGSEAREELENIFNKKIYLETYVKTIENWKDRERYLKELGFKEN